MDMNAGKSNVSSFLLAVFMLAVAASILIALLQPKF